MRASDRDSDSEIRNGEVAFFFFLLVCLGLGSCCFWPGGIAELASKVN